MYKKIKKLSKTNSAYIAGIVDGEGTITLTRLHKNENRRAAVTISNTENKLLQWILKTTGVGKIIQKNSRSPKWKPAYVYEIYSQQAIDLLRQITPCLRTYKKERAILLLRTYKKLTPRNGKYTPGLLSDREKFVEEFFDIK